MNNRQKRSFYTSLKAWAEGNKLENKTEQIYYELPYKPQNNENDRIRCQNS